MRKQETIMASVINTNVQSINAQRNLNKSQSALGTSLQRLSSGLRINSAKDDAAGLAISNRFSTQVRGLNVAVRNANDGISFAQTTEGALSEVTTALQRIRDLAVQSANDTNSASDRQSLQAEVDQLVSEIDRIAGTTNFNGTNVLDGSKSSLSFQIGANANQTVSVKGVDAKASSLGSQPGVVQSTSDRVQVENTPGGTQGIDETVESQTIDSFNITVSGTASSDVVNIAATRYGGNITSVATANLLDRNDDDYGSGLAKATAERINSIRVSGEESLQGVYASASTSFKGSDLANDDYSGTVNLAEGAATITDPSNIATTTNVGEGSIEKGDLVINGVDIAATSFQENDADGSLANAINAKSSVTGVTASVNADGELELNAEDGRDIVITTANAETTNEIFGGGDKLGNGDSSTDRFSAGLNNLRVTGQITVTGTDTLTFGGTANANLGFDDLTVAGAQDNVQATGTIANADITTVEASNLTIESVDSALAQVDAFRADLGAVQNRFESTIRNLSSVSESLSAANSRILDADFASETATLAKNQVLQQAGISILAQANALPQQALSLLG
jgi:flagellin